MTDFRQLFIFITRSLLSVSIYFGTSALSQAGNTPKEEVTDFTQWQGIPEFIDQIVAKDGFNKRELEALLRQTVFVDTAVRLMQPAPSKRPKNWRAYRARFVEPVRINAGIAFWERHAEALARAEAQFGIPAEIIVGILGVETVYGRNTGNFRVMDVVTTLAFAYPESPKREARMAYFKGELENTLLLARERGIDPFSLRGSYAGAIGWPQFMPGSIRQYAIDFDGDGQIDLRNSEVDAIGSVANFLVEHGWKRGTPIVFPASIRLAYSRNDDKNNVDEIGDNVNDSSDQPSWQKFIAQSLEAKYTLDELAAGGVVPGTTLPSDLRYGLIDLQNGTQPTEFWLGTDNFFAITQYNRSFFYAMSVIDLGRSGRAARSRL